MRPLASELERLWTLAETGMTEEAYRGLRELEREHPDSRDIATRRYWLVTAFPELEPARDPLEVVGRLLADDPGQSPMWGEVRLRAQIAPNWPFEPFFDEMLESARTPMPLSILYDIRWQAAIQIGSWRLLLEDIPTARLRFREHPSEWARMLLQVVDKLAWIGEPAANRAFGELVIEIERASKGDRALDFELDRLDFLRELAPQWLRMTPRSPLEALLHDFVAISWRGRWEVVRARMIDLCRHLAGNVTASMKTLDLWAKDYPLVLAQVVRTINEGYHLNRPRQSTPDDMRLAFNDFLSSGSGDTARSRPSLVQFFQAEQNQPEDLVHAIDRKKAADGRSVVGAARRHRGGLGRARAGPGGRLHRGVRRAEVRKDPVSPTVRSMRHVSVGDDSEGRVLADLGSPRRNDAAARRRYNDHSLASPSRFR